MKKLLITITLVLFSSSAFAGSCLKLVGKVDEKMQQVMELRDAGKKAHEEGDHAKSEELLIKALNLFKSWIVEFDRGFKLTIRSSPPPLSNQINNFYKYIAR